MRSPLRTLTCSLGFLVALLFAPLSLGTSQEIPPDALIKSLTEDTIVAIKNDPGIQAGDRKKLAALVGVRLAPHFDFVLMTRLVMGVNWRRATPEEQGVLTEEFGALLIHLYSGFLKSYQDEVVIFKPFRMAPDDTDVLVRLEIKKAGTQALAVDINMTKTPTGWKIYDITVGGVSLVITHRESFAVKIRESGIDGLIQELAKKNRELKK